jgi:tripeptide aminopeptidase
MIFVMTFSAFKSLPIALLLAGSSLLPTAALSGGLHAEGGHGDESPTIAATVSKPATVSDPAAAGVLDEVALQSLKAAPLPQQINPEVRAVVDTLAASVVMRQAFDLLKSDQARFVQEAIQLSEIPAPTFEEAKKAQAFAALLRANGLTNVRIDSIGNVIGVRKGSGKGPSIAVIAHLDTVFDAKTDLKVSKKGSLLYGPGLTDDSAGLAMMLSCLRTLNQSAIETKGDLVFVGSVGEEGNGDLRGVKQFFKDNTKISGVLIVEAAPLQVIGIMNTGSNRFQVDFNAPGGHSYAAFGQVPSAIHAQGRFIAKVADLQVPAMPKTTFTVGLVSGGRSVNTIAPNASLEIDIRSNGNAELQATTKQVLAFAAQAAAEENKRWGSTSLSVSIKQIGARPGGMTPPESTIVQTWMAAAEAQGVKPMLLVGASTDAGVPISLGIPTIVVGFGGKTGGFHALDENWDPTNAYKGVQMSFLTMLALAGVNGITQPLIQIR